MREWCGCGASIRARRSDVLRWRTTHRHDGKEEPEPQREGAHAYVENAGARTHEYGERDGYQDMPVVNARIGFTPNEH